MSGFNSDFWYGGCPEPYQIDNSLRFRGGQQLSRTVSSDGNRKTWTISVWVKYAIPNGEGVLWMAGPGYYEKAAFKPGTPHDLSWAYYGGAYGYNKITVREFRDPSAWMHFVFVSDTTNGTASERKRLYINGVRETAFNPNQETSLDFTGYWNQAVTHRIGVDTAPFYFNGYMAEFHSVDGTALAPTDFGKYNADGVWVPKEVSGVTYGTNGFYLDFSDPSNIGADRSGNGNNWTPTGFELSSSTSYSYDWVTDTPTSNHPVFNRLTPETTSSAIAPSLNFANMRYYTGRNSPSVRFSNNAIPKTGKWYQEFRITASGSGGSFYAGSITIVRDVTGTNSWGASICSYEGGYGATSYDGSAGTSGSTWRSGPHFVAVAIDCDTGDVEFFLNGVSQSTGTVSMATNTGNNWVVGVTGATGSSTAVETFYMPVTQNAPPAGYSPLFTDEYPEVDIKNPSEHFQTVLDTGANILSSAQSTFSNGLWWVKDRANSNQHQLVDSVRGGSLALRSPLNNGEASYVTPSGNSVAWCWSAPDSFTPTSPDGLSNLSGRRNVDTGFSIVTYTGSGSNASFTHGLSQAPEFRIHALRNANGDFPVQHISYPDGNRYQYLTSSGALASNSNVWNGKFPDNTYAYVGTNSRSNSSSSTTYVAYLWHSVPGYSAFGSYVGKNTTDNAFCYTGFRPAWVMVKTTGSDTYGYWTVVDSSRDTYNPATLQLHPNLTNQEQSPRAFVKIDLLSNGFKIRDSGGECGSNQTYIYMAFAEHPFGGSNCGLAPAPAR